MVGTSLEVWWLRLCGSTVGGVGLISGQGTKILYVVRCSQKINKIKNKKYAVNICNGWKNEIMPSPATWMDLEIVIQVKWSQKKVNSELWSQRQTNIIWQLLYAESKYIYIQMNLFINRNRVTDIENIYQEERWGEAINWKFEIDRYTLLYLK